MVYDDAELVANRKYTETEFYTEHYTPFANVDIDNGRSSKGTLSSIQTAHMQ